MDRQKISVIFGTNQDMDVLAFKYVILSLNQYQNLFEFYFPDIEEMLPKRRSYEKPELIKYCNSLKEKYTIGARYFIVLVNKKIAKNYFSVCEDNIAVVTTHKWEKYFSPPSVFEFIIASIIANTFLMDTKFDVLFHGDTIGCIFDYKRLKTQIRPNILLGYICDEDKNKIISKYGEDYYNQIKYIISHKWIGDINNKGDIAYNLKHCFKININKDSGFEKSQYEKAKEKFVELPFNLIILLLSAIISIITSYIVYHILGIK